MFSKQIGRLSLFLAFLLLAASLPLAAQSMATIRGTVTRAGDNDPLVGALVSVKGMPGTSTAAGATGKYTLVRIPTGPQTLVFRWLGYAPVEKEVVVKDGMTVDVAMEPKPVNLADITVSAASREPERVVVAPASVTTIEPRVMQNNAATGQAPMALAQGSGVDLAQSGVNDFNINARGFNSSLNRRVLTLLDGRDLAIAFLGSQEWNSLPVATDELRSMELVHGPGSALYGPNAFAGVLNMTTLSPRESQGGKISVAGGELNSFKADARWAGLLGNGSWGLRVNGGYSSNDTWTRSRTSLDSLDLKREYQPAFGGLGKDSLLIGKIGFEAIPLAGQTANGTSPVRSATGSRDPITALYGTARLDHYVGSSVVTVEGGASQVENEVLVTGIGRVQVLKGTKPYARIAFNSSHFNLLAYLNHRSSDSSKGQRSLASGALLLEKSTIEHVEGQANTTILDQKLRVIGGASFRQYNVNTQGTLMRLADDDRHDKVYAAYGQAEYSINKQFRLVGAARYDEGDLFSGQWSPKVALVFSPNVNNAFRVTYNQAFQTPNYSEFYLKAAAAPPANFLQLEGYLRQTFAASHILDGVAQGALFTQSATVPVWARGNAALNVEKTRSWEGGYKGALNSKTFVTVDAYFSSIKDFVTDLLPGVNPTFQYWTPPTAVPSAAWPQLVGTVKAVLGSNPATALAAAGLTRTEDGNTGIVVSYTNAGKVDLNGLDFGFGYQLTDEFRLDATYSLFSFTVKDSLQGDKLLPNTPKHKETLTIAYQGRTNGFDADVSGRFVPEYDWAAGVFAGKVPSSESINASVGYQITPRYRFSVNGTNIFNQQRYQLFGGSLIGRRVLAGLTARF